MPTHRTRELAWKIHNTLAVTIKGKDEGVTISIVIKISGQIGIAASNENQIIQLILRTTTICTTIHVLIICIHRKLGII